MNVEITALADANLEEIYRRIREDSPGRAAEWRKGLVKATQTLDVFPERAAHSTRRQTAAGIGSDAD